MCHTQSSSIFSNIQRQYLIFDGNCISDEIYRDDTGAAWKVHDDDETLRKYGHTLVDFLACLLKTMDDEELGYKLPMTEYQREMAQTLLKALEQEALDIPTIHKLFYSYMAPPAPDAPIAKWTDAIQCFLAVINLREDGTFTPVLSFTPELAHWEYLMRGAALYETISNHSSFGSALECVVYLLC